MERIRAGVAHMGESMAALMLAAMTVARCRLAMDVWLAALGGVVMLVAVVMLAVPPRIWQCSSWPRGDEAVAGTVLAIAAAATATFPAKLLSLQTRRNRRYPTRAVAPQ